MSRTLSPDEHEARFTWLTTAQVAKAIGADALGAKDGGKGFVRQLLREGLLGGPEDVMDIGRGKVPVYVVHPRAVERYRKESVARYVQRVEERAG